MARDVLLTATATAPVQVGDEGLLARAKIRVNVFG